MEVGAADKRQTMEDKRSLFMVEYRGDAKGGRAGGAERGPGKVLWRNEPYIEVLKL